MQLVTLLHENEYDPDNRHGNAPAILQVQNILEVNAISISGCRVEIDEGRSASKISQSKIT